MNRKSKTGWLLTSAAWMTLLVCNAHATPAIEEVMQRAEKANFSGVVLVGDSAKVLYEKAAGSADNAKGLSHSADAPWRWASVSKQVTAVIVAQLVAEGKLALDKTIADYLSSEQFGGRDAKTITIRQLLQHTSGLPNPDDSSPDAKAATNAVPAFYRAKTAAGRVHSESAAGFCAGAPKRAPGEQFEYNNCDYLVLGAVIERVTGEPFAAALAKYIAQPLKLSTLKISAGDEARSPNLQSPTESQLNLATYGAAGALMGSPRDLLALDRALMGNSLLSADMKREFWKGDSTRGYAALGVWAFSVPLKECRGPVELIERRGEIGDVQVRNIIAPQLKKAVVVFTDSADWTFGEIWQGNGFSYDLLSAALCSASKSFTPLLSSPPSPTPSNSKIQDG